MLAPVPKLGNGYSGLTVSLVNTAGVNPRPLLCPPNRSNHSCAWVSSSAGTTVPQTTSAIGCSSSARATSASQCRSATVSSSSHARISPGVAATATLRAFDSPGTGAAR